MLVDITSLSTPFISAQRLSELPLPCITVCHRSSAGLYRSLSAQRLSERIVYLTFANFAKKKKSVTMLTQY